MQTGVEAPFPFAPEERLPILTLIAELCRCGPRFAEADWGEGALIGMRL
jgi:hypothetical protein